MKNNNKEIIKGIISFLLYMVIGEIILYIILFIIGINPSKLSEGNKLLLNIIYELLLIISIFFINKNTIINHFNNYKKRWFKYFKEYFLYWVFVFFAMMAANMIIYTITNIQTSTNQEQVIDSLYKYPIYTGILSIFLAPLLEELVFRLSFRKMIKNDRLFIILSGLAFGLLHLTSATSIQELLYIIPYAIPGFIFAYTLVKSKNIFVPISLHFLHNTVLIVIQIILVLL